MIDVCIYIYIRIYDHQASGQGAAPLQSWGFEASPKDQSLNSSEGACGGAVE